MSRHAKILSAFGFVYIVWGSTFVAIRYSVRVVDPALLSGLRFMIASLLLMASIGLRGGSLRLSKREFWKVAPLGFVMFTVNTILVNYSSRVVPAGVTALILATTPLMIAVFDAILPNGRGLTALGWAGIVTGFIGLSVLINGTILGKPLTGATFEASGALLIAAAAWAIGSVAAHRMTFTAPPLLLSAWQMLVGGSISLLIAASIGGSHLPNWTARVWLAVLYLAIFGSLMSYTSYLFLLRNVRLSAVSTYAYINPVVAVVLGALLLNESLSPMQVAGMILVVASVAVVLASTPTVRAAESV
jgi:drug/metabolite transporter (DMT)-like permease